MENVTQNPFLPINEYGGILNLTPTAGKIELFGRLWPVRQIRPDYQAFIKEIFQPADKCLEVLLGMRLFITGALQFQVQALSGDEFSWWWNNILESEPECDPEKVWEDIFVVQDKITEIYRVLMISAKAGQIDSAIHASTLKIGPPREECYLSTKSFISWAIENGYSLPDILGVELGQKTPVDQKVKHASTWESPTVSDSSTHSDQGQEVNMGSDPESTTVKIFPLPGTSWEQIKIRYVNDNHIEIYHPGVKTHAPYSMADLGLNNKPSLEALFKLFANKRGEINGEKMGTKTIKANVSNLRKHLKQVFPNIKGSPIANFSKQNGYCCNFKISTS